MSTTTETAAEKALRTAAERFAAETKLHEMTILHDQNLYRHVRFMDPKNSAYWYDLITVPGSLIFRGDGESFVFARERDMFGFFRSNPDRLTMRISPDYWAEKLTSDRDSAQAYSEDAFNQYVSDILGEAEEAWPGVATAWAAHAGDDNLDYDLGYEAGARQALDDFEYRPAGRLDGKPFRFTDTWEASFKDFDWWFLWALHGIVAGIAQYDAAKAAATKPVEAAGAVA